MIQGIDFDFGGRKLTIPPLTLGALEGLQDRLFALKDSANALDPSRLAAVLDAAFLALKRNYPEMTREQVGDLIDLGNMQDVLAAVTDVSGLRRKAVAGETKPQLETPPAG